MGASPKISMTRSLGRLTFRLENRVFESSTDYEVFVVVNLPLKRGLFKKQGGYQTPHYMARSSTGPFKETETNVEV